MPDSSVEVLSETVLDGLRLSDWIEQAGISRSAAYELLKLTGVEPEPRKVPGSRKPVSHLTPEQIEVLMPLAQQLSDGATMPQIRKQLGQSGTIPNGSGPSETALSHNPEQSGMIPPDTAALAAAIASAMGQQQSAPSDPLKVARALVEAADLGVALNTRELAEALGFSPETVGSWKDGHSPRPGFTLHRQKAGNAVWWTVKRMQRSNGISGSSRANGMEASSKALGTYASYYVTR